MNYQERAEMVMEEIEARDPNQLSPRMNAIWVCMIELATLAEDNGLGDEVAEIRERMNVAMRLFV